MEYVPDEHIAWWWGRISQEKAAEILMKDGSEGKFLVKESESSPGDCVLSVIRKHTVIHHQIHRYGQDCFFGILDNEVYHGLDVLIEKYMMDAKPGFILTGFVKKGPPPDLLRSRGTTKFLHKATEMGSTEMVEHLLKNKYKFVNAKNEKGMTCVHIACKDPKIPVKILELLKEYGAHMDLSDLEENKPLHYACQYHTLDAVKLLIENKSCLYSKNLKGCYPLHEAAKGGKLKIVKLLLESGAAARPRNIDSTFPISYAIDFGHSDVKYYLNNYNKNTVTNRTAWFHPRPMNREVASKKLFEYADEIFKQSGFEDSEYLKSDYTSGIFLVRISKGDDQKGPMKNVISLLFRNEIKHYIVSVHDLKYYFITNGPYFHSLEELVEYYMNNADGIPCKLQYNLKPPMEAPCLLSNLPSIHDMIEEINIGYGEELNIQESDVKIVRDLGEGNFGMVSLALVTIKNKKTFFAVKKLKNSTRETQREFLKEASILTRLRNPNIVEIVAVVPGTELMIIQQFMKLGALDDYLEKNKHNIELDLMKVWAFQIASGMHYLETKKFIHRDLAARNILLEAVNKIKVSDFGMSRVIDEQYYATTGGSWPIKWYAPESIEKLKFTHASDVWSYAVCLWEIYTLGDDPYYCDFDPEEYLDFINEGERLCKPDLCPQPIYEMMLRCWEDEPDDRPTFTELMNFFK